MTKIIIFYYYIATSLQTYIRIGRQIKGRIYIARRKNNRSKLFA